MMGAIVVAALVLTTVLEVIQSSKISQSLSLRSIDYLTYYQVEYWQGRIDRYVLMARTVANIMEDYEDMDQAIRRDRFDSILLGTISSEPNLNQLYTVWKPNAVDGMDAQYIGREGSTSTGQYAIDFVRETGGIKATTSDDIAGSMAYFNGLNSKIDRVETPFAARIMGRDTHLVRIMVPIINRRTNETVGGVGLLYDTSAVQPVVDQVINRYEEIYGMAIYANDGRILGHLVKDRIGKRLTEVEGVLYGSELSSVEQSIRRGEDFFTTQYSTVLNTNLVMVMHPFRIGNSDVTWTVMIGTAESYVMKDINDMIKTIIIMISIILVVVLMVVFIAMHRVTKPIVEVAATLMDIAQGEGDLTRVINVSTKDEIGDLGKYFNETIDKIKNLVITIKQKTVSLADTGNELASNMT
jgi:methyl-accepting chemotaxis protein